MDGLPGSTNVYELEAIDGGTRATFTATSESADALQQVQDMGVIDGACTRP